MEDGLVGRGSIVLQDVVVFAAGCLHDGPGDPG